jgi:hypothetical protein
MQALVKIGFVSAASVYCDKGGDQYSPVLAIRRDFVTQIESRR